MKKILVSLILCILPILVFSQQSVFEYVEGEVTIKKVSGALIEAQIGDSIIPGDSVITGYDGFAELTLENSSKITIDNDTVFVFSQREKKEEKKSIFMVVLGKIGFKFDKLLNEPDIQTPATVAGIRGTEFTVVSALDGSSLYIVDEGSVAVEAEGALIVLQTQEGVEVPIGDVPGEKFEAKFGSEDYSQWLLKGENQFKENPTETLISLTVQLKNYIMGAEDYYNQFIKSKDQLIKLRNKLEEMTEGKNDFYQKNILPLELSTSNLTLNYRYYAVSAYSLRKHVISSMYVNMKTKYLLDSNNPEYLSFLKEYDNFLSILEDDVVPYLIERDV